MRVPKPHFVLRSEVQEKVDRGEWKFVLTAADGSANLEVSDEEAGLHGERLELLSVVRALEALDQPSVVTLAQGARSVRRVLSEGLDEWRRNGWMWECYGEMVPIKNRDLWQRLDRALTFHKLETRRIFRIDPAHELAEVSDLDDARPAPATVPAEAFESADVDDDAYDDTAPAPRWRNTWRRLRRRVRNRVDGLAMSCAQLGSPVVNTSWVN